MKKLLHPPLMAFSQQKYASKGGLPTAAAAA